VNQLNGDTKIPNMTVTGLTDAGRKRQAKGPQALAPQSYQMLSTGLYRTMTAQWTRQSLRDCDQITPHQNRQPL
tara:strand:- start:432 stop:653 length:222 start_codon:yes stop_codon:yes gene_type:complete